MKKIVSKLVAVSVIFAMAGSVARVDFHLYYEKKRAASSSAYVPVIIEQVFNA